MHVCQVQRMSDKAGDYSAYTAISSSMLDEGTRRFQFCASFFTKVVFDRILMVDFSSGLKGYWMVARKSSRGRGKTK